MRIGSGDGGDDAVDAGGIADYFHVGIGVTESDVSPFAAELADAGNYSAQKRFLDQDPPGSCGAVWIALRAKQ